MKRSIVIISLGVVGTIALAMRPAFTGDQAKDASVPAELQVPLASDKEREASMDVHYSIDLERPLGYTCYLGKGDANAFEQLEPAKWGIRIYTEDGKLKASCDAPVLHAVDPLSCVSTNYVIGVQPDFWQKMPDNSHHRLYNVIAICQVRITPSFWQSGAQSVMVQSFQVDVESGTVEPDLPYVPEMTQQHYGSPVMRTRMPMEGLPQRISGTAEEQALSTMLFTLGAIESPWEAKEAAKKLPTKAKQALARLPHPDKAWPECWGAAAPMAQEYAKRITPTLVFLQEKECFGVTALVDFINGPDFSRFFGESFADKVPDPLDEPVGGFPIEQVPLEQLEDETDDTPEAQE